MIFAMKKRILPALMLGTAFFLLFTGCRGGRDYVIKWEDPAVEAGFRGWLGQPEGDIYRSLLDGVVTIDVSGVSFYVNNNDIPLVTNNTEGEKSAIRTLADLRHCFSLERLMIIHSSLPTLDSA